MGKRGRAVFLSSLVIFGSLMAQAANTEAKSASEQPSLKVASDLPAGQKVEQINDKPKNESIVLEKQPVDNSLAEIKTSIKQDKGLEVVKPKLERKLPANYKTITILGEAKATEEQAVAFIKKHSKNFKLQCSAEDIVKYYYEECEREGVRADLALCQALLETGFFTFKGTVQPKQNNFCGLGTTGKSVVGASFRNPKIGVRAHIQHLLAYSAERTPTTHIVDPRYNLVRQLRQNNGFLTTWYDLNGKWAASSEYSEKIFDLHSKMLAVSDR